MSMLDSAVGSLISGAFGLGGSALNYAYSKKLAAQQNEYNLQMWNLQNEYNSPQNQMRRFEEAGLNPNLIYGQGNAGNASSAPQMVTPEAPKLSKEMAELGKAFNIEGLRTIVANRRKATAEAKIAETAAEREGLQLFAEKVFGRQYGYDPASGMYVQRPAAPPGEQDYIHPAAYYINRILADNFRTNSLLIPRSNLIGSQRLLNTGRLQMTAPQIQMLRYQSRYFPATFWIGNVKNAVGGVAPFVPLFK